MSMDPNDFFCDTPGDWAYRYRALGIQVLACRGKIPADPWKEFQNELVSDGLFATWYGPTGKHASNTSMGMVTGAASGRKLMLDLDTYKSEKAAEWWFDVLATWCGSQEPVTWEQITGGGGRQLFFECPDDWMPANASTDLDVDIRGVGGFAVLPPTIHASGRKYAWKQGHEPWFIPCLPIPVWLIDEIDKLIAEHGGGAKAAGFDPGARQGPDGSSFNNWGRQTNQREDRLYRMVYGVCCDWRRARTTFPTLEEQRAKCEEKYVIWEGMVDPKVPDPAKTKTQLLDEEGRGPKAFWSKFQRCMAQWDGRLAKDAAKPPPGGFKSGQFDPRDFEQPKVDPATGQPLPLLLSSTQFLKGFVPPNYLVDGVIQKHYLYALTARTGHGKTAVAMLLGQAVARGAAFHSRSCKQGNVLFLAGENPQDIRARFLMLAHYEGFDPHKVPFYFVDGVIDIAARMADIKAETNKIGPLALIIVDTSAAYFRGDDANNNVQQGQFAQLLRALIRLPGNPAVLVNCHPTKAATKDNLVPLGGVHFLNEIDGNLTLWSDDRVGYMGPHTAKWRGAPFNDMGFEFPSRFCPAVRDAEGREMSSVIAVPITDLAAQARTAGAEADENALLKVIHGWPNASFVELAKLCGWSLPNGEPNKQKVQRLVDRLKEDKLIFKYRGSKYRLNKKGCKVIGVKFEKGDNDD